MGDTIKEMRFFCVYYTYTQYTRSFPMQIDSLAHSGAQFANVWAAERIATNK